MSIKLINEVLSSDETVHGKCPSCGGAVVYSPDEEKLVCNYCGAKTALDLTPAEVHENDFAECMAHPELHEQAENVVAQVSCQQCGASTTFPENTTSFACAFCGTPIVIKNSSTRRAWKPEYILPFKVGSKRGNDVFRKWASSRWFAPNDFASGLTARQQMKGVYLPYWTYDADTTTHYSGERGITRHVSRRVNGRTESHTVTDWYPVSGTVRHFFDDVLIPASDSLPRNIARVLTNWDKRNYVSYNDGFVRGFLTELYKFNFRDCYPQACKQMEAYISELVSSEIGGDEQRIDEQQTDYNDVKFKHILLPVWISAYRYKDKSYIFAINGRTGQVAGQRPYSAWKIALAVIALAAIITALFASI